MIQTPAHGTLPSGHATEAFTMARVLWTLMSRASNLPYGDAAWGEQLMRLAARVAINRTVAGVHFPIDSVAGAILGLTLARYLEARCSNGQTPGEEPRLQGRSFDGTAFPAPAETSTSRRASSVFT